jgi:hypothetical protein
MFLLNISNLETETGPASSATEESS